MFSGRLGQKYLERYSHWENICIDLYFAVSLPARLIVDPYEFTGIILYGSAYEIGYYFGGATAEAAEAAALYCVGKAISSLKVFKGTSKTGLTDSIKSGKTPVIGKMPDLNKPGAIKNGEFTIAEKLPNLGNQKANWTQNSSVLRQQMSRGVPIRDASVNLTTGELINNTGF